MIEAPHTSNWDFIMGWIGFTSIGVNVRFLIKKESFIWPIGGLLKKLGGMPVDRHKNNNMVEQIARQFEKHESLVITITPEGTRKKVEHWKKGFYYIALHAKVPIVFASLDYKFKEANIGTVLWPSGDYNEDWKIIEAYFRGRNGRHPEKYNLN